MKFGITGPGNPKVYLIVLAIAAMAMSVMASGCGSQGTENNTGTSTGAAQTNVQSGTVKPVTSSTNASNPVITNGTNTQSSPANQSSPASPNAALPTTVGECSITSVASIGTRLVGQPNSGSAINYVNGGYQVSYDTVASVQDWRVGDQVKLCLVSIPTNCPPGDNRGKVYNATNIRTNETWEASDSEHNCGGA
ncbi:MAG: hypothetical protein ACYC4D_09150 [Thermoleophilia bacterium]